jgi:hypothetical protein
MACPVGQLLLRTTIISKPREVVLLTGKSNTWADPGPTLDRFAGVVNGTHILDIGKPRWPVIALLMLRTREPSRVSYSAAHHVPWVILRAPSNSWHVRKPQAAAMSVLHATTFESCVHADHKCLCGKVSDILRPTGPNHGRRSSD